MTEFQNLILRFWSLLAIIHRTSCPQNEGMNRSDQGLILRPWSLEQRVPSPHCEDLLYKKRCISTPHFEALNHFCGCSESKRQNVALILGYPYPENRDQLVHVLILITRCFSQPSGHFGRAIFLSTRYALSSKRERSPRNAPKFALICSTPTDTRRAHQNAIQRVLWGTHASLPTFCRLGM